MNVLCYGLKQQVSKNYTTLERIYIFKNSRKYYYYWALTLFYEQLEKSSNIL
jgi:hypothetical protein